MKVKRLTIIVFASVIIWFVPLLAMQFTDEVNWTFSDFIIAGILLIGTGLMCELVTLLLAWAELAVGILGTPLGGQ